MPESRPDGERSNCSETTQLVRAIGRIPLPLGGLELTGFGRPIEVFAVAGSVAVAG